MSNFPVSAQPISVGSVNATKQAISAKPYEIHGWQIVNQTGAEAFVQVFNKAVGDVTVGTTVPDWFLPLPASGGAAVGLPKGIPMSVALTIACTTTKGGNADAACDVTFLGR